MAGGDLLLATVGIVALLFIAVGSRRTGEARRRRRVRRIVLRTAAAVASGPRRSSLELRVRSAVARIRPRRAANDPDIPAAIPSGRPDQGSPRQAP